MSAKKRKAADPKPTKGDDKTTLRTNVTEDEHEAVRWFARVKCGLTLDEFVRQSVDQNLQKLTGKPLAVLAEEAKTRGKLVQEELF